ncbi:MAG: DUF2815 family protein [Desulfurellales bacterium]|nr:MAG: DUF2815 family protein [Desulfurellales bacterium]
MAKKNEVKKAAEVKANSVFTVTEITPKGIKAMFGGVRLNWPFLAQPKQDNKNPLKAQYRLQAILGNGEKEFIAGLKKACEQYLMTAAVAWGGDVRTKVLKQMFTLGVDKSFFKTVQVDGADCIVINAHSTVTRDNDKEAFAAKYPPRLVLVDGTQPASVADAEKEFYSGVYADVAVWIQAYDVDGSKGLSVYLNGVRKLADGERIAGDVDPFAGTAPTALPAPLKAKALL